MDSKQIHTFYMSEKQAVLIHELARDQQKSLKNHIASAVESGDFLRAQKMVTELRAVQAVFAQFNIPAKHLIATATGKPLKTEHEMRSR